MIPHFSPFVYLFFRIFDKNLHKLRSEVETVMNATCFLLTLGAGMAAGAVVCSMLPRECTVKKMVEQAAESVEDAAKKAVDSVTQ